MRVFARLIPVAAVAGVAAGIVLLGNAAGGTGATTTVRVKVPAVRVCINTIGGIKVGVRWFSGPRRYRVEWAQPVRRPVSHPMCLIPQIGKAAQSETNEPRTVRQVGWYHGSSLSSSGTRAFLFPVPHFLAPLSPGGRGGSPSGGWAAG